MAIDVVLESTGKKVADAGKIWKSVRDELAKGSPKVTVDTKEYTPKEALEHLSELDNHGDWETATHFAHKYVSQLSNFLTTQLERNNNAFIIYDGVEGELRKALEDNSTSITNYEEFVKEFEKPPMEVVKEKEAAQKEAEEEISTLNNLLNRTPKIIMKAAREWDDEAELAGFEARMLPEQTPQAESKPKEPSAEEPDSTETLVDLLSDAIREEAPENQEFLEEVFEKYEEAFSNYMKKPISKRKRRPSFGTTLANTLLGMRRRGVEFTESEEEEVKESARQVERMHKEKINQYIEVTYNMRGDG